MNFNDIITRKIPPKPWQEGEKIPWNEPGFSKRMLEEHLSQSHDAASRRMSVIDQHVEWINQNFLLDRPSRVLDLGCGPGLYTEKLTKLGHDCIGIDFSPASIEYAKSGADLAGLKIEYRPGDIRHTDFGAGYDLILFIFGEFNIFKREEAEHILCKAYNALNPGGLLVLEPHTDNAVQEEGQSSSCWHSHKKGLFSDFPHIWLEEHFWDSSSRISTTRYFIIDVGTGKVERYASSNQAYTNREYEQMMSNTGFLDIKQHPSLTGNKESYQKGLFVITAQKKERNNL